MTQETPVKVFSLLGVALTSMFFLFAVSVTNANFERTETVLPMAFEPSAVVAVIDQVAGSYDKFVTQNLLAPLSQDFAFVSENVGYVAQEAGPSVMKLTGLQGLNANLEMGQVAGASVETVVSKYYPQAQGVFGIFYQ